MLKKVLKNERGLTLVELLAVIVILGIVAAIAVPTIGSVIQKSRENAVKADAIQVLNAAKTYVAENGAPADTTNEAGETVETEITKSQLEEYVDNAKLGESYSVSVSGDGKTFELNTGKIQVGKITIQFTDATIADINADKEYGKPRTIQ
ncbi:type II secretion system GspH family protein [Ectobacillus sp. JY-23]|uniref:type IV pilin protein n=1 Tax=Ectobacillus sp. JY-23 TaxID=2933872 RepID=UPI001FF350B2|nr:type II secretion system protein [Ectobacillus sp. JY-23]UOY92625.1 type II secretion system GspH family protein [Ectobacillus sp. JY-23]